MKKLLLILIVFSLTSCLGTKKIAEKNSETSTSEKTEVVKDSSNIVEVSKPIKDEIIINVPKSDNEAVNKALDAILKQLNTSKTSGSNSYISRYDSENERLLIEFLIGQTQNQQTTTNTDTTSEKTFEERTDEYIKKKVTALPWWIYLVAVFLLRKQIVSILSIFFPQIKTVSWVTRLTT